jgi:putative addiction module component (TIGR02574 family)
MNALAEKLAEEALTLPKDDRAGLVDVLLRSLNPPREEVIDRLWAEEADRRVKEIEDGRVTLLDGHEVLHEIRERLRR